jgi:hypothetical protein
MEGSQALLAAYPTDACRETMNLKLVDITFFPTNLDGGVRCNVPCMRASAARGPQDEFQPSHKNSFETQICKPRQASANYPRLSSEGQSLRSEELNDMVQRGLVGIKLPPRFEPRGFFQHSH